MAANFNLLKLDRYLPRRDVDPFSDAALDADLDGDHAFLSERGMILIACFVFCALAWTTLLLWIFS